MQQIEKLISLFQSLPTIGKKTATKIVVDLLSKNKPLIDSFMLSLTDVKKNIKECSICHNISVINPCHICVATNREDNLICIVESIEDLWVIENYNLFKGKYHVLGGALSAVQGVSPKDLNLFSLEKRLLKGGIDELIIAINAGLDGQTTSLFISDLYQDKVAKITKLGYGLPLGSDIGYLDEGTINAAFQSRTDIA